MFEVTATVEIDPQFLADLETESAIALEMAGEAVRSDLILSQTMPFDVGTLQDDSTFVETSKSAEGEVNIVSSTPYARRLYFHPEYNFQRGKNPNAGGRWLDPYLEGGAKGDFFKKSLGTLLTKRLKKWLI